jgi:hypothetical protein
MLTSSAQLRCDVKQDPVFHACSRCNRLQLSCKIDDTFKRVGKRSRNAEMEREIQELRRQVEEANKTKRPSTHTMSYDQTQWATTDPAVAGLMDLRSGNGIDSNQRTSPNGAAVRRLEEVVLTANRIDELFELFFSFYHHFLPFLNPDRRPDEYFQRSSLLFWTIIAVAARHYKKDRIHIALAAPVMRLTWQTLAEVPQNYHVVKALCLLCTWPFSTSSTSTDPTFMLCGAMMHIALQIGLHRPSHSQDFTKFKLDLREAEVADRVRTWATCNIVAQRVATAYGQPVNTIYDWTLSDEAAKQYENHALPSGIYNRLQIEMFVDKVSKTLYINHHDSVGIGADHERSTYVSFLTEDYNRLTQKIALDPAPVTQLYLRAAYLHLRLCVFFSPPDLPSYQNDLLELYKATTSFLELCLSLDSQAGVTLASTWSTGLQIIYASNYIFQMMLAAGFSLLKLNHTFLRHHGLDTEGASQLFTRTTWALRSMSVADNDLAERLAEVLAQVWRTGRVRAEPNPNNIGEAVPDENLQLKVKCRMSMSHVFDSVWRWRQNFQFKGKSFECEFDPLSVLIISHTALAGPDLKEIRGDEADQIKQQLMERFQHTSKTLRTLQRQARTIHPRHRP